MESCNTPEECGHIVEGMRIDAYTAAALGDLETLTDLVGPQNVSNKNTDGWTFLMYACYYDRLDAVKCLVALGADLSIQCENGKTALMIAAESGNIEIIPLVMDCGILELKEKHGLTALCLATEHAHQKAVKLLLGCGADPNIKIESGSLLILAIKQGNFPMVKTLLRHKANPYFVDKNGKTAECIANEYGHSKIAKFIDFFVTDFVGDVKATLINLDMVDYIKMFEQNQITFEKLLHMTEEEMKSIGMKKFGPRRKLTIFINELKQTLEKNG